MKIEDIAQVTHNVNAAYCKALGDNSQKNWGEAPQWQKDSAIKGVQFIKSNPNASPSASHESWLKEKKEAGWKYGAVKDEKKKEHPCIVEYDKLPPEQKAKDYIFGAVVRSLLPVADSVEAKNKALTEQHEEVVKSLVDKHGKEVLVLNDKTNTEVETLRKQLADAEARQGATVNEGTVPTQNAGTITYSVTDDGKRLVDLSQLTSKPLP